MKKILLSLLFIILSLPANAFSLSGKWYGKYYNIYSTKSGNIYGNRKSVLFSTKRRGLVFTYRGRSYPYHFHYRNVKAKAPCGYINLKIYKRRIKGKYCGHYINFAYKNFTGKSMVHIANELMIANILQYYPRPVHAPLRSQIRKKLKLH